MALARVTTWNPGDTLKAADLNGEFNNVLNNPMTLVSPTTGAINFNTQAHTNLVPGAITASSGAAGSVLVASTAATSVGQWTTGAPAGGTFITSTASIPTWLAVGSSGQCLIAATSGVPVWSTGINFVSTSRVLQIQKVAAANGTAWTSNNFSLTTGWGSTAVLQAITGTDQAFRFTVLTGGPVAGNPSITTTFTDQWAAIPIVVSAVTGGSGLTSTGVPVVVTPNTSGLSLQVLITPTSGVTYIFQALAMG